MNIFKRACIFLGAATVIGSQVGCSGATTTGNVNLDVDVVKYDIDSRTGVCYAGAGYQKPGDIGTQDLSFTYVPCTAEVLKKVSPDKLSKVRANGIKPVCPVVAP